MLLMLYRYVSGVYQLGDFSALSYIKGLLDGGQPRPVRRVLSISGHGIGEPEIFMSDRFPGAAIDALSYRLIDTQLLQFLRTAGPAGVAEVFEQFKAASADLDGVSRLLDDAGLVPYWEQQAEEWSAGRRPAITVYSNLPDAVPASHKYDFVYVSNSAPYLQDGSLPSVFRHVAPGGLMAVTLPAQVDSRDQFSRSAYVQRAREMYDAILRRQGYAANHRTESASPLGVDVLRRETIPFPVPAPAHSVLVGELLLHSMQAHISDRIRLEALSEVLLQVPETDVPVKETLDLLLIEGPR
jgi:hypothetical protein